MWEDESRVGVLEMLRGRGAGSGVETEWRVWSLYDVVDGKLARRRSWTDNAAFRAALPAAAREDQPSG